MKDQLLLTACDYCSPKGGSNHSDVCYHSDVKKGVFGSRWKRMRGKRGDEKWMRIFSLNIHKSNNHQI